MASILQEFREFAIKGNVVDLAVGVVIGAAFTAIVNSLVADIITPPIGWLTGGINFHDIVWRMPPSPMAAAGAAPVTVNVGNFINAIISFTIVAWVIFLLVKGMNSMKRQQAAAPEAPAAPAEDVRLLTEIRDLLKNRGA